MTSDLPVLPHQAAEKRRSSYGWVCVAAAALAMIATLPGRTVGLAMVAEQLLSDFQIDRTTFGLMNLWATIIGALFGLAAGPLIDRLGVRFASAIVAALLGGAALCLTQADAAWQLTLILILTRGFGQSALSVAAMAIVGKWFGRKSAGAMALFAVLLTVGFIIAFGIAGEAIQRAGWRAGWTGVGIGVLAAALILWLIVRDPPVGWLETDTTSAGESDRPSDGAVSITLGDALRTPTFWAFAAASGIFYAAFSGFTLFTSSVLLECGYDGNTSLPLGILTLTGLIANGVFGWLGKRSTSAGLMGASMLILAVSLASLSLFKSLFFAIAITGLLGFAGGGVTVVFFVCWGETFGTRHLGRIQGAAQAIIVMGSAAGPLALGWSKETLHSYGPALWLFAGLSTAASLFCWLISGSGVAATTSRPPRNP